MLEGVSCSIDLTEGEIRRRGAILPKVPTMRAPSAHAAFVRYMIACGISMIIEIVFVAFLGMGRKIYSTRSIG